MSGIYQIQIRRSAGDLFYVGQALDIKRRSQAHLRELRRGQHFNRRLQNAFNTGGEDRFSLSPILVCSPEMLAFYEQKVLDLYIKRFGRSVLNLCRECVSSSLGTKRSQEVKAKLSLLKKGKPGRTWSDESRKKLSESKRGKPVHPNTILAVRQANTGRVPTLETRQKMSASHRQRKPSAVTKEKMRVARSNAWLNPIYSEKVKAGLRGNKNAFGRIVSDATRLKMSEAAKAREARNREVRALGDSFRAPC